MLIEDNEDAALSLGKLLRMMGHEVQIYPDGPTALAGLESCDPEIMLIDIGLPGMDGCEIAVRVRQLLGDRTPLLIAQTGYGQEEDLRRTKDAGFDHHLVKPIDPEALAEVLAAQQLRPKWQSKMRQ